MNSRRRHILRRHAGLSGWNSFAPFSRYSYANHKTRKSWQRQLKRDLNWLVRNGYLTKTRYGSTTSKKNHYHITKKGADVAHLVNMRNKRKPDMYSLTKHGPMSQHMARYFRWEQERI